ncbi:hypothetical protein LIER_23360 [Lithospermum erythrorhizon]|uniref:Uncharacterized protein n=1 Tax=Lithospermum erythrorhizon TaxID=34254 RepID=A0AAV3QZG2_LITER
MNLALLTRQGWRIAYGEASLLYKVLKGRYFIRTPFLHAKLGLNPSFGWRSILEGRKVLLKGIRWRFGDGRSIDVWKDPWVPRLGNFRMFGGGSREPRLVSQLIVGGQWDTQNVVEVVAEEVAHDILAMPLIRVPARDKLIWHHTKCGNYLTAFGYKCAKEMKGNGDFGGWARVELIHGMHVPSRNCGRADDILFNGERREWNIIWELGIRLAGEYKEAQQSNSARSTPRGDGGSRAAPHWQHPTMGFIKINVNASYKKENNSGASGAVER